MIKILFLDFGNVIYLADQMIAYRRFADFSEFSPEEIHKLIYLDGIEKIPDEGGSFEEFYDRSISAIKADKQDLTPEIFHNIWCDIFNPVPGMDKVLGKVKPNVKMFLVSNTNAVHWEGKMSKLALIKKYFPSSENRILSFEVGKRKPNKLMWIKACEKAGCNPGEALFVDDLPEFVSSFQDYGGKAFLYNAKQDALSVLVDKFVREGII